MNTFFQKLKKHKSKGLPFVIFSNPGEKTVKSYLQRNNEVRFNNNFNGKGFVFAPFDSSSNNVIWFYADDCEVLEFDKTDFVFKGSRTAFRENELDAQLFHQKTVSKALDSIHKGELHKVIVSRKEAQQLSTIDIFQLFQNICLAYPKTFCYCWFHPKVGLWIGATPETLVSIEKGNFETVALAGTQSYVDTIDVTWGVKEQEEQKIVVDAIVTGLNDNNAVSSVFVGETVTQKAGVLLHLKTPILATLKNETSLKSLIEVLHPTPAVCGLPYKKSKEFILGNEGYDRKYYTGYLGEVLDVMNARLFVNLRCMEVFEKKNEVMIYVGGGITSASNPEKEWLETVNKSQVMKSIL